MLGKKNDSLPRVPNQWTKITRERLGAYAKAWKFRAHGGATWDKKVFEVAPHRIHFHHLNPDPNLTIFRQQSMASELLKAETQQVLYDIKNERVKVKLFMTLILRLPPSLTSPNSSFLTSKLNRRVACIQSELLQQTSNVHELQLTLQVQNSVHILAKHEAKKILRWPLLSLRTRSSAVLTLTKC